MSDSKKYYYLKLKENYFDREEIRVIKNMPKGDTYVCIIIELHLRSLKRDGLLMMTDRIPYNINTLSAVLGRPVDEVKFAIDIFKDFGLVEVLDTGEMFMSDIQNFIGTSSTEGDRKREYRKKIETQKELPHTDQKEHNGHLSDVRPPELELETELKTEKESIHAPDKKPDTDYENHVWGNPPQIKPEEFRKLFKKTLGLGDKPGPPKISELKETPCAPEVDPLPRHFEVDDSIRGTKTSSVALYAALDDAQRAEFGKDEIKTDSIGESSPQETPNEKKEEEPSIPIVANKKNDIQKVFELWNKVAKVKCRAITDTHSKALNGILKEKYTLAEVLESIDMYWAVVKDEKYFYSYEFRLEIFLKRRNACREFIDKDAEHFLKYKTQPLSHKTPEAEARDKVQGEQMEW